MPIMERPIKNVVSAVGSSNIHTTMTLVYKRETRIGPTTPNFILYARGKFGSLYLNTGTQQITAIYKNNASGTSNDDIIVYWPNPIISIRIDTIVWKIIALYGVP